MCSPAITVDRGDLMSDPRKPKGAKVDQQDWTCSWEQVLKVELKCPQCGYTTEKELLEKDTKKKSSALICMKCVKRAGVKPMRISKIHKADPLSYKGGFERMGKA